MEQKVGRYTLLRRLAVGGMGEVHLAAQGGPAGFERVVALKRMLPAMAAERELVKLFLDEARLVSRLSHRNICQIYELGEGEDGYFVAMELVQGTSVRALVDRLRGQNERIPPAMAVDIAAQVADALAYAYEAPGRDGAPLKIIHRDVSPHNVLLSISGDVKLIDFGVAKSTEQSHATESGTIKGKIFYMSPEQTRGQPLDQRSDLFALGVVLYEMLSGKNPFARPDVIQSVMAIQSEPLPPLTDFDPVLEVVDPVVARLCAKSPADRFNDGYEAAEELSAVKAQLPRAGKRLGPFVSERFADDISAVIRSVSDSEARRALKATPQQRDPSTPRADATEINPAPPDAVPLEDAETRLHSAAKPESAENAETRLLPSPDPATRLRASAPAAAPRRRWGTVLAAGAFVVALGVLGVALRPVLFDEVVTPDQLRKAAPIAPSPAPVASPTSPPAPTPPPGNPPAAEPGQATAEPKPPEPVPGANAGPATAAAGPTTPAEPAKGPEPAPAAAKDPDPKPTPGKPPAATRPPTAAKNGKPPKKEPKVAAAELVETPAPVVTQPSAPPTPAAPVATVSVSGPFGRSKVSLAGSGGHVMLGQMGELSVGLDWSPAGDGLAAKITCEPWAILSIDGVSKGRTPIALPGLGRSPLPVELRRLGGEPVQFLLSAEMAK